MTATLPWTQDWRSRFLVGLASGIDGLALGVARALLDRGVIPPPGAAEQLRATAAFYCRPELATDPRRFFAFLDAPLESPEVWLEHRSRRGAVERVSITFPSHYLPQHPEHAAEYAAQRENHAARIELWQHEPGRARGTLIGLHGFAMGKPALDAQALMAPAFFRAGLDVALFTLPLHGARSPRAARFSGQLFASPDIRPINEAIAQAVHDLARFILWLRARSDRPIGLVGLSLGGYVAALMAALDDDLAFVVPMVAPVCFGDLAYRFMLESRHYRGGAQPALSREEFRAAFRIHSPLAHAPRVPRERLLIIAGRGDRVVPGDHALWLWEHWGRPAIHWFSGSHIVPFGRRGVLRAILGFLSEREILSGSAQTRKVLRRRR